MVTIFIAAFFQFGVFGAIEKRQSCTLASITSFVNGLDADCLSRLRELTTLNVEVARTGTISTSRVDAVANRTCTKTCGKLVVDFSRDNNCANINLPQNLNLEALCSNNTNGKRCIQVLDEVPGPSIANCTSTTTCSSNCMTEANNYKNSLGCCFGTLKRSLTSFVTTSRIDNCNIEAGDSCPLVYSGGVTIHSLNWLFALTAACLTYALAFN